MAKVLMIDNKPVKVGDRVKTFRGEEATVVGMQEPRVSWSTGRVYLQRDGVPFQDEFYPGVINAHWKEEE